VLGFGDGTRIQCENVFRMPSNVIELQLMRVLGMFFFVTVLH